MMPPRFALWLLTRSLHPDDRDAVVGDVLEEFNARVWSIPMRHTAGSGCRRGNRSGQTWCGARACAARLRTPRWEELAP